MPVAFCQREGHANGRRGRAYSFMHNEVHLPEEALRDDAAGKIFTIAQPKIVCVLLDSLSEAASDVQVVVPVFHKSDGGKRMDEFHRRTTKRESRPGKFSALAHPIEPVFSETYNKVQGATKSRIILVLNNLASCKLGNMSVNKFFVAFSRVKEGKHAAMFPVPMHEVMYLTKLKHDPWLRLWNSHYDDQGRWLDTPVLPRTTTALLQALLPAPTSVDNNLRATRAADLRKLCRELGIHCVRLSEDEMREQLKPWCDSYFAHVALPAASAAARASATTGT